MAVDQRHVHNQFYHFCHQIQDKYDKIMFIISMNNTRQNNINLSHSPKAKFMHAKVTTWSWTHILVTIYHETALQQCVACSKTKFSYLYNYQQTYTYQVEFYRIYSMIFAAHNAYLNKGKGGGT